MRKLTGWVLALIMVFGSTTSAFADCCDSFLGCAAAYVTDGLSCVMQELISTVKNLIDLLNNLSARVSGATQRASDYAVKTVNDTISQTRSDAQQASSNLAAALQQANTIYKQETSLYSPADRQSIAGTGLGAATGSSTPAATGHPASSQPAKPGILTAQSNVHSGTATTATTSQHGSSNTAQTINGTAQGVVPITQTLAPHGALAGLFEKAVAQIQKLKAAGDLDFPKIGQLMTQAQQSEGPGLQSALAASDKAINDPIRNMTSKLQNMLSNPTTLFDPSDIVNQLENDVLANLDTNVNQMVETITAGPQRAFDAAQPLHDELVGNSQLAQQIASAMQKAYSDRSQASQNALGQLLPLTAVSAGGNTHAKSLVPSGMLQPYSQVLMKFKNDKQKIAPQAKQQMQALVPVLNKLKTLHSQAVAARSQTAAYKSNFEQKLNAAFANKTQAEINAQRDQLISQARSQFANDPKTRDKVIALLTSETAQIHAAPKH